jgi:hypothetical protein
MKRDFEINEINENPIFFVYFVHFVYFVNSLHLGKDAKIFHHHTNV